MPSTLEISPGKKASSQAGALLPWTKLWIVLCAACNVTGWVLSLAHHLDFFGYAVATLLGLACLFLFRHHTPRRLLRTTPVGKLRWRARHALPLCFGIVAVLATVGGSLYAPSNYDSLTYRFPRILHWFAHHGWYWIDTAEDRCNISAVGFEWLMCPLFALTKSDRLFFLINVVSYLLLPGLLFSTLTRMGVAKKLAWIGMWLIPTGYCFAAQAGSVGNDSFSTVYLLAALCFCLESKKSGKASDLWYGILAAALLSGAKASNAPLFLPISIAALPSLRLLLSKLWATALVLILFVCISFAPTAALNFKYTGDWAGDPTNGGRMKLDNPFYGVVGNSLQLLVRNSMPPIMPFAQAWNAALSKQLATSAFLKNVVIHFPRLDLTCNELEQEEAAAFGLGIGAILLITFAAAATTRTAPCPCSPEVKWGLWICLGGGGAMLFFMAKMGSEAGPRIMAAYYPLLVAAVLLHPSARGLVVRPWWRRLTHLAAFSVIPVVILTPSRPLWPAQAVFRYLSTAFPGQPTLTRAKTVYAVYQNRADCLAPLRQYIPPGTTEVAFLGSDDPQIALWRPFGSRVVVDVTTANQFKVLGHPTCFISSIPAIEHKFKASFADWVASVNGEIIGRESLLTRVARGPQDWVVVKINGLPAQQSLPPIAKPNP